MNDARLWLVTLAALPALVIGASLVRLEVERLRRLAVGAAAAMLLVSLAGTVSPYLRTFSIRTSALSWAPAGLAVHRLNELSAPPPPFPARLSLLTAPAGPRP